MPVFAVFTRVFGLFGMLWYQELEETEGFEPSIRYNPYNGLANRRLQPLGHVSLPQL